MTSERPVSAIDGVHFGALTTFADERGSFRELWRASLAPAADAYTQVNLSTSAEGVLRGLHLHRHQLDHWVVTRGRCFVALVDVRPMLRADDPAPGPVVETRELRVDDWVDIPIGVAHGFLALEPLELLYLVTNEYDGSDERGFAWDDTLASVPWPPVTVTADGRPILSTRDRSNPSLAELVARLRAGD